MALFTDDITDPDVKYTRDLSFPMQYNEECDTLLDEDEEVIEQSLQLITFTNRGTVLLFDGFGSTIQPSVFDPLDDTTQLAIDTSMRTSFEINEERVFIDKEFSFDETPDENKLVIIIPYKIKVTGRLTASRFIIPRPLNG